MRTKREFNKLVRGFLTTLRRVPNEIVLGTAVLDIDLDSPSRCLVGSFVRAEIANMVNKDIDATSTFDASIPGYSVPTKAAHRFGGTYDEWTKLYFGVGGMDKYGRYDDADLRAATELAFVRRVNEAVAGR